MSAQQMSALGRQLLAIRAQVDAALACLECVTGASSRQQPVVHVTAQGSVPACAQPQRYDVDDPTDMLPRVFGGYAGQPDASDVIPLHPSQGEGAA